MHNKVKKVMMKAGDNMKDKKSRALLLTAVSIVCVLALVFIYFVFIDKPEQPEDPIDPNTPEEIVGIRFDLVSYEVFDLKDLSFKFALVKVRIKDDKPINVSLTEFSTSEGTNLNDVNDYISELADLSVFLGKVGVDFDIESEETSAVFSLFVPLKDKQLEEIDIIFDEQKISIDLFENVTGTAEQLGVVHDEGITDDKTFKVTVSAAIDITGEALYQNNEISTYPSTAQLMAFRLILESLNGDPIVIEEAEYITEETSDTFVALDGTYERTEKRVNIISVSTTTSTNGYLLFMTLNPERVQISYTGILRVKINGVWSSVEIDL